MLCIYGIGCVPIWLASILIFLGLSSKQAFCIVAFVVFLFAAYCFYKYYKAGHGVVGSLRRVAAVLFDIFAATLMTVSNGLKAIANFIAGIKS